MKIISDLEFAPSLQGDLFLPDGTPPAAGFPAAVLIHGGGWSGMCRHDVRGIADFLVETGFAVFNVDYRLMPQHRWPAGFEDCKTAVKWLIASDSPVDRKNIFVVGGSAGGHYALLTGLALPRGAVRGIVSISGIDDIYVDCRNAPGRSRGLLGEEPNETNLAPLDPATYCSADAPPILCTHWRRDKVVSFAACAAFEASVLKKGGRINVYAYDYDRKQEGHGIWIPDSSPHRLFPDLEAVIAGFLKEVLSEHNPKTR